MAGNTVILELDASELQLPALVAAARDLNVVVGEVAADLEPRKVQWVVEILSKDSPARLAVRPVAADAEDGALSTLQQTRLVSAVSRGVRLLEEGADRPPHYGDRALEKVRDLANYVGREVTGIRLGDDADLTNLGRRVADNAAELLRPKVRSWGTVEGLLESMTVRSKREFSIYDLLTGQRIRCNFGRRIAPADIGSMVERRVAVYGEIRARESGVVVSVIAESLDVLPTEAELPPASAAIGVLRAAQ